MFPLTNSHLMVSIAALAFFSAMMSTHPTSAIADDQSKPLPEQLVEGLHGVFGNNHARAVHAKGLLLEGTFTPTPDAKNLSKAALFAGGPLPVTIRFSDFTGIPDISDAVSDANPRGLALKFKLPDGSDSDIVTHSFNGFPVATAGEFVKLLGAIAASGPKAAKPTALEKYFESHPKAKTFLTTQTAIPASYATITYYGVNSFAFTNAQNSKSVVRYRFVPKAGEKFLDEATSKSKGPKFLAEEITTRVSAGPIVFDWYSQISGDGDKTDDPSVAWPESRKLVNLGTISVSKLVADQAAADKAALFLPGNVPAGIEAADPMIEARTSAYPISASERQ